MCGIVGFTGSVNRDLLDRMNGVQRHRGPDDSGKKIFEDAGVSMAMQRLGILDLAGGHQPMQDSSGRYWIVFNGEIFNAPELRAELSQKGYSFKTKSSDTEVLLNLYADLGHEMAQKLNGMFAFVIFDTQKRTLFGARDPFGIKPLFYSTEGARFSWASEIKSLLQLSWIERDLDLQSVQDYLSLQYVPAPATIYGSIRQLIAGSAFFLDLESHALHEWRYYSLTPGDYSHSVPDGKDPTQLKNFVKKELSEAVDRWTWSDVPVACSLSGGLDSAAIVALMTENRKTGPGRIRTYTLGFKNAPHLNETDLARSISKRFNTAHHEIWIEPEDLLAELPKMVRSLDEPYGGGLPSWFVFKAMSQDVKVAMTGSGGDEVFGNYGKWAPMESWRSAFSVGLRRCLRDGISPREWILRPRSFFYPFYLREKNIRENLFISQIQDGLVSVEDRFEEFYRDHLDLMPRDRIALFDFLNQLPQEFLMMTDRFSMAHSIEARTPFLDKVFVEKMFSLDPRVRTRAGDLKGLLKDSMGDLMPPGYMNAPKKGFVLPMKEWLATDLLSTLEELFSPDFLRDQGLFKTNLFERYVAPHASGVRDNSQQLWTLMMFQMWYVENFNSDSS